MSLLHFRSHDDLTPTAVVHAYIDAVDTIEGHLSRILSNANFVQNDPSDWTDRGEQPKTDLFWTFIAKQAPTTIEDDLVTHLVARRTSNRAGHFKYYLILWDLSEVFNNLQVVWIALLGFPLRLGITQHFF